MKRVASGILPIIVIDRTSSQTLQRQIYDSYRAAIVEGRLRPGQRVPSTRMLAADIGVSRFPVLNAYSQLLAEGYLEGRIGAGTVVSSSLPEQLTSSQPAGAARATTRSGPRPVAKRSLTLSQIESMPWLQSWGAFRVGQVAFDQFPQHIWSDLVSRHARNLNAQSAHYGNIRGSERLRQAIANYLNIARSVRCEAGQIMIVNGSQQALEIAIRVLLEPGSRVWMEEPGYRRARDAFQLNHCHLVPVPVDTDGLDVAAGTRKCRKARAAFVTPSHQNPLGVTMSATRRLQLVEWAQRYGSWIIEDDYDSEYRYESLPIASLQGLDSHSRVIYIGTFSKVLFPALRLGYLVIPPDLLDRFRSIRLIMDLGPPTFFQDVLADFIEQGHFARHLRRMRVLYGKLRAELVSQLNRELATVLEIVGDEAGMHLTAFLKNAHCDIEVAHRAARLDLSLWPLSPFYLAEPARQGFILGFSGATTAEIATGVGKLRTLLTAKSTRSSNPEVTKIPPVPIAQPGIQVR